MTSERMFFAYPTRRPERNSCESGACNGAFLDCNNNKRVDGCEINGNTDVNNCGSCGGSCSQNNINRACSSGSCEGGLCLSGYLDCDNNKRNNGCETNGNVDVTHCGGCNQGCSTQNITASCAGGACNGTCNNGFGDCNNDKRTDGCETDISASVAHCGACGQACSGYHVTSLACVSGNCSGTCETGWADCNANRRLDGCESRSGIDTNHCTACNAACPAGMRNCVGGWPPSHPSTVSMRTSNVPPARCSAGRWSM